MYYENIFKKRVIAAVIGAVLGALFITFIQFQIKGKIAEGIYVDEAYCSMGIILFEFVSISLAITTLVNMILKGDSKIIELSKSASFFFLITLKTMFIGSFETMFCGPIGMVFAMLELSCTTLVMAALVMVVIWGFIISTFLSIPEFIYYCTQYILERGDRVKGLAL